jgi:ketosteroid isomerase-like protein
MAQSPRELVMSWVAAFNARDADAAAALYSEHAVNTQFAAGPPVVGRAQMRAELCDFFAAFPDITTHPIALYSDGEWAIVEWIGTGTWEGDLPRPASQRTFVHPARMWFLSSGERAHR